MVFSKAVPPIGASLDVETLGSYEQHKFTDVYDLHKVINSGGYGMVFTTKYAGKAIKGSKNTLYATKVLDRTSKKHKDDSVMEEVEVMRAIRNIPGVIELLDFYVSPKKMYIVQVCAEGGDVFDRLAHRSSYTEYDASQLAKNLLTTLLHLQKLKIVHRDLKPENLLLTGDNNDYSILVCDFGFAKKIPSDGDGYLTTRCGTPDFVAPEVLSGEKYRGEVDLWSTGCIVFLLLCGYSPFQGKVEKQLFSKIKKNDYQFHHKFWSKISIEAKTFISNLLTLNREIRWTAEQALECKWIQREKPGSSINLVEALGEFKKHRLRSAIFAVRWALKCKAWNTDIVSFSKATVSTVYTTHHIDEEKEESQHEYDEHEDKFDNNHNIKHVCKRELRPLRKVGFFDFYEPQEKIQSGGYSSVYKCMNKATKEIFAVKIIQREKKIPNNDHHKNDGPTSSESDEIVFNEVAILQSLGQYEKLVCPLVDFYEDKKKFYLVMEYMAGGDVFDRIVKLEHYTEHDARDLVKVLLTAIEILHKNHIVHHDLKPQNLLLQSNSDNAHIKLIDFGFAKRFYEPQTLTSRLGTPSFVAPEILKNIPHDQRCDLWSIGVITYVLLVGYMPFAEQEPAELFGKIRTGTFEFDEEDWANISKEAREFVTGLLKVNPMDRWSIEKCLNSNWIKESKVVLSSRSLQKSHSHITQRRHRLRTAVRSIIRMSSLLINVSNDAKEEEEEHYQSDEDVSDKLPHDFHHC